MGHEKQFSDALAFERSGLNPPTIDRPREHSDRKCLNLRLLTDRRRNRSLINSRHLGIAGRRRANRRENESYNRLVDWYQPHLLVVVLAIVLLSCLDALLTLNLLHLGAIELNTLMGILIERDVETFVNFKIALTGLAVIVLVIYHKFLLFGRFKVYRVIWLTLVGYSALIVYELVLLAQRFPIFV